MLFRPEIICREVLNLCRHIYFTMKRSFFTFILFAFVYLVSVSFKAPGYHTITIKVTNIRNSKGTIQLQIFRSAENYNKGLAWKVKVVDKSEMKNNSSQHTGEGVIIDYPNNASGQGFGVLYAILLYSHKIEHEMNKK